MASIIGEAVVGKICEMAVEMAVRKLAEEAKLGVNFREDFIWLKQELNYVRGFLQDADQQPRHREDVKQWVESIRDIAMHAEDIFEECALQSMYGDDCQFCGLCFSEWIFRRGIARQIKDIKDRMRSIAEKGNQLKLRQKVLSADETLPSTSQIAAVELKRSSLLPSDSRPVGIKSKVDDILNLLENPASAVIAVVGMGGLGKTYLLQHVYNQTKERYEKSIWLSVSQSYSISKLQYVIASHLDLDLNREIGNGGDICRAAELIHEKLQGTRFLVVFDDVWRAAREEDLLSKLGLPSGNNSQSKIVVTTRNKVVCTNLNAQMYEMPHMSDEDSWRLFCVYAFGGFEENIEPQQQLKEVGRKIVKQCGNLPLAIKTIAASLANTTDSNKWESKLRQLERSIGDNDPIMDILKLSYDSLPARLKACFAYLSFFPEDEDIDAEYLINLWIGEGFIPAGEDQLDVAWDCLHQLANLCLLQLWEDLHYGDLIKHCKVHDLLLDLAIHISKENKCAFSVEEASTNTSDGNGWCRVLLAKKDIDDNAISESRPVCLRTLSLSQNSRITSTPQNLFIAMRGLRVLDLSGTEISALPASVGMMKLLKVLNLKETKIQEVPECVRHLKSLSLLALPSNFECTTLPEWIGELQCLQHLECEEVTFMPKGISKLASLRTLRAFWSDNGGMKFEDLTNMTQLQELGLIVLNEMQLKRLEKGIFAKLVNMRRLEVKSRMKMRIPEFVVPSCICGLANLRVLKLWNCDCSDYPELQRLPNLVSLYLDGNKRCRELPKSFGKSGGFPHLRFFTIMNFSELAEFPELEEGAMACLEMLELECCHKVNKVGQGLERLKTRGVVVKIWERIW